MWLDVGERSHLMNPEAAIAWPTFLVVGCAVFKQAAELVAIEMQEAQLVSERGFLQDVGDNAAQAVLGDGQAKSQGQSGSQVDLLHYCRLLHSSWRGK